MSQTLNEQELVEVVKLIIDSGVISVRDVDSGDEPFIYSSGSRGPGYTMVKGLVGQPHILQQLVNKLVKKIDAICGDKIDFVNGNVTGGMLPGWEIRNQLSSLQNRKLPYTYLRGSRKEGGHNELITGDLDNPDIQKGMRVLIVEELVNFGQTTCNAVDVFRDSGYTVEYTTCILDYGHEETHQRIDSTKFQLISLITLPQVLDIAEKYKLLPQGPLKSYKQFLQDPLEWQISRKMVIPEISVKEAMRKGYKFRKLDSEIAATYGAPKSKLNEGIVYYRHIGKREQPFLYVALDFDTHEEIYQVAKELADCEYMNFGFKVNLDSVLDLSKDAETPYQFISTMKSFGRPIFVDLKMWNGVRTMTNIIKQCVELDVDIVNVYCHIGGLDIGGYEMNKLVSLVKGTHTKLFGVTVLTHYSNYYRNTLYGAPFVCSMGNSEQDKKIGGEDLTGIIPNLVGMAGIWELDGVILPAPDLHTVTNHDISKMCPGIRPDWVPVDQRNSNNQTKIMTPWEAVEAGADYLVVGTPIIKADNRIEALNKVLDEMKFQ